MKSIMKLDWPIVTGYQIINKGKVHYSFVCKERVLTVNWRCDTVVYTKTSLQQTPVLVISTGCF